MSKLSIVVPVYNVSQWVPVMIGSVLNQLYRDWELILVDDGSTDGSGQICDSYCAEDNRIRVIHQKNAGVSVARNVGVAAASGEFIGFVDADDIIEPDMYALMTAVAEKYGADIVQCQHDRTDTFNGSQRSSEATLLDGEGFVRRMFTKTGGHYTNQVALWSKVYRRNLFDGILFPEGRVYEDEQETYKLCLKADIIVEIPDILYHYIKRENSIITGVSAKKMLDKQQALLDRMHYLPQRVPELEKECCRSFLQFSEYILCRLYESGELGAVKLAVDVLLKEKERLRAWINKYERIYLPALRWGKTRAFILKNDFEPIQKCISIFMK